MTPPRAASAHSTAFEGAARVQRQLLIEADKAHGLGKPAAAALMQALARTVPHADALAQLLGAWPGDLARDAITFRLCAGLHALARSGRAPELAAFYQSAGEGESALGNARRLDAAVLAALRDQAAALGAWIARPTQTNEVARVAGLIAVLMDRNAHAAMPCEILELGASAGLNLNFAHYACRFGTRTALAAGSPVQLAPAWRGSPPTLSPIAVTRAAGVDLDPLDPTRPEDCARLEAYVWPGERERSARLAAALALAREHPPQVDRGRAGDWLARMLAAPQPPGTRRVVFHAMVMQYADPGERARIDAAFADAGLRAGPDAPLVRVGMEWRADRRAVELMVTIWDGGAMHGRAQLAAHCHPYGEWFDWRGLA